MISFNCFIRLLADVQECGDLDIYVDECGGSVQTDDAQQAVRLLEAIWTMAHGGLTIKQIASACGISVRQIGIRLGIPGRTLEQWSAGLRNPPAWQMPLIAFAVLTDYMAEG